LAQSPRRWQFREARWRQRTRVAASSSRARPHVRPSTGRMARHQSTRGRRAATAHRRTRPLSARPRAQGRPTPARGATAAEPGRQEDDRSGKWAWRSGPISFRASVRRGPFVSAGVHSRADRIAHRHRPPGHRFRRRRSPRDYQRAGLVVMQGWAYLLAGALLLAAGVRPVGFAHGVSDRHEGRASG
jgi:hypothetical protein